VSGAASLEYSTDLGGRRAGPGDHNGDDDGLETCEVLKTSQVSATVKPLRHAGAFAFVKVVGVSTPYERKLSGSRINPRTP